MTRTLLAGFGALAYAYAQPYVVNTIAGHGILPYPGDGKPAVSVNLFDPRRVAFDPSGNLYFTESYYHRVFKLNTAGILSVAAGNGATDFDGEGGPATAAALPYPAGVAVDSTGALYVGADNRLCKIANGKLRTIAGTGNGGNSGDRGPATLARIHTPEAIAVDSSGNVYFSDTQSHVVRRVAADGIITTVAGTGTPGYSGDNGPATAAQFSTPEGLAIDSKGNVYVADRYNNRVRKIAPNGNITTFAGTGEPGTGGSSNAARDTRLFQPEGVAVDSADNLYIADTTNNLLRTVDPNGVINTFSRAITSLNDVAVSPAGWLAAPDFLQHIISRIVWDTGSVTVAAGIIRTAALGDRGLATDAYLIDPWGVAADPAGNLYVADNGDQRIRKITPDGTINTAAGNGIFGASKDGQPATALAIAQPRALAADSAGNLYFNSACLIRVLRTSGALQTVAGTDTCGFRGDAGAALSAQLQFPRGLAVDAAALYIADTDNNRIRRVNFNTGTITTIAGTGQRGYAGNNSDALLAKFDSPLALAVDAKGNVYVADEYNHRVRKISGGLVTDFAGNGLCDSASDGLATAVPLCYPSGLASDSAGNVYIADSGRIRRVSADGRLTTIAGTGWLGMTGEGEPAMQAAISPFYLALDSKGRACFSDWTNIRIRCLDAAPAAPPPTVTVVNAATFLAGPVAPGEIVTLYGTGIGPNGLTAASLDPLGPPLATALANSQITFDGVAAPLLYVSSGQSSAIVPFAVAGKASTIVEVTFQNKLAARATLPVAASSPGLFTMASSGSGQGAILNQDWSVNSTTHPALPGDVLMLFGTGGGVTDPPGADGHFTTGALANLACPVTVTIAGSPGTVYYAGAAPNMVAGVFQINVTVPAGVSGDKLPIVVKCGGASSPVSVTVAIK
jgi:trimeric autotransporter adhesin